MLYLLMCHDGFYFPFFFSVNKVWRWWFHNLPMLFCCSEWREECHMEDWVNSPLLWEFQLVCDQTHDLYDFKWAFLLWRHLLLNFYVFLWSF